MKNPPREIETMNLFWQTMLPACNSKEVAYRARRSCQIELFLRTLRHLVLNGNRGIAGR
jgi:hypothetical protein